MPKKTHPFYSSKAWKRLRTLAKRRDNYRCTNCGADVRRPGSAIVDHVKPRSTHPDLALFLPNLRTLCRPCDNARHREKGRRRDTPQIGADGFPVGSEWSKLSNRNDDDDDNDT
ncbi:MULTISPECIES: HNH endonuclease [unclassified Ruegeria]|uniref:HNH endonuclease n=1 Tax=unclassified Ruegeria TaxID=2625375 RepID=UPI00148783FB|nr:MULTISPECIES: HNH endonuclease [unclassified Ruegeria]